MTEGCLRRRVGRAVAVVTDDADERIHYATSLAEIRLGPTVYSADNKIT